LIAGKAVLVEASLPAIPATIPFPVGKSYGAQFTIAEQANLGVAQDIDGFVFAQFGFGATSKGRLSMQGEAVSRARNRVTFTLLLAFLGFRGNLRASGAACQGFSGK